MDPRDQTWEVVQPKYRVYFYDMHGAAEEYEVAGADVDEVWQWAVAEQGDRTFVLYACVPHRGLGLVRLLGDDPNDH